ncbi:unnamed protein product [Pleuronectes platessa]|uniref:Uncharacterized protein n=1 Tax=Pleuronectes platessa TaxID=8262 RepID=A0A9N7Z0C0_PLEPL|nr:unnamed protein product [Pleuronectes platessa]
MEQLPHLKPPRTHPEPGTTRSSRGRSLESLKDSNVIPEAPTFQKENNSSSSSSSKRRQGISMHYRSRMW